MNNAKIQVIANNLKLAVIKHSPELLTGLGIAGMLTATVMAVRATPKALHLLEDAKLDKAIEEMPDGKGGTDDVVLTPKEIVKATWRCYVPAAVTIGLSVACLISANSVNARRNAALATAYTLSESALKEYQEKVVETIGEKKEQEVRDDIAKDKIAKNPPVSSQVIITGKGTTLCYDSVSGRYFESDIEKLRRIENNLNKTMISDMYISLNDFYYEIGLPNTRQGEDLGWNINKGLIDLEFSSQLTDDGRPCLVVGYGVAPRYDYL